MQQRHFLVKQFNFVLTKSFLFHRDADVDGVVCSKEDFSAASLHYGCRIS